MKAKKKPPKSLAAQMLDEGATVPDKKIRKKK